MKFGNIQSRLSPGAAVLPGLLAATALAGACAHRTSHSPASQELDGSIAAKGDAGGGDAFYQASEASTQADSSPAAMPDAEADPEAAPAPEAAAPDASTGPQSCGLSACAPGQPCPDLTVDTSDLLSSVTISTRDFAANDCAIAEGCITQTGTRRLLRFDTGTQNTGNADLSIGDPTQNTCFQWSACHGHYHFRGVGRYTLYQADGTTVAAVGHKQGFCLEDVEPIPSLSPPPADPASPFVCTNQGLHVGFEDVYPNNVDCQWIDITGLAAGQYVLDVIINAEHYLPESNYGNNEARIMVTIPAP